MLISLTEEAAQTASKYTKNCLTPLIIREMQINLSIRLTKILAVPYAYKDMEQWEV